MNAFSFTQRTGARILAAVALFSLIAGMMPMQAFAAAVITDGFEAPDNISNWTSVGWSSANDADHTGSKSAKLVGANNAQTLTRMSSTVGYDTVVITFWYLADSLEDSDKVEAFYTTNNGSTWIEFNQIDDDNDDENWHQVSFNVPAAGANNANFGLRFDGALNSGNDKVWIDDVTISGTAIPTDLCSNITGVQATVPSGYYAEGGQCFPNPVDVCPNDVGVQTDPAQCTPDPVACTAPYTGFEPNCVPPPCESGTSGTYPNCVPDPVACTAPYTGFQPNCVPPPCEQGQTGTYPNCVTPPPPSCTDGLMNQDETGIDEGGVCTPPPTPCEAPYTGNVPNCVPPPCESGTSGTYPNCVPDPVACTAPYTGFQPNCVPPPCEQGQTGTYPNCVTPVVDVCSNIPDNQVSVPIGYHLEGDSTCVPDEIDPVICENTAAQNYGQEGRCIFHVSQCSGEPMNLLSNGSFEEPEISKPWDKSVIAGWTVAKISDGASSLGEIWRGLITPSHLAQNIELDGDYPTKITQTVATIPGATYELSFDFAARSERPAADNNAIKATADTAELVNVSTTNTNWVTYGNTFVATDSATDITLADMGTNDTYGTLVDNAILCLVQEPEPVDFCDEIKGTQTQDEGYLKDKNGMCYMPITSCSVTVVSDATNTYNDASATLITAHPAWVQTITDSIAKWIWGTAPEAGVDPVNNEVQTFKKTFVWSGSADTAILKLASDNGYSVKLNGTIVAADSGEFNYSSLDTIVDLTDDVIVGVNTLEISVTNLANGQTSFANNPGGVIYDLTITSTSGACAPEGEGDGDGDDNETLYRIQGYVWHDNNRNAEWDGNDDEQEGNEEDTLAGFKVRITNNDGDDRETTTDENGFYYFDVPAGTWVITEVEEGHWFRTTQESFTVTVPAVPPPMEVSFLDSIMNMIVPVAYAQAMIDTYGPYNFGNDERRAGGGGGGNNNDGEPDGEVLGDSDDADDTDEDTPEGEVLGEQVDAVPAGAPDAGAGGTSRGLEFFQIAPVAMVGRTRKHG